MLQQYRQPIFRTLEDIVIPVGSIAHHYVVNILRRQRYGQVYVGA